MALPPNPASNSKIADRKAAQQDGFLREVDDALREDEFVNFAKRYGRPLGIGIVAALLALAAYLWWDHSNKLAAAAQSEKLVLALDKLGAGPASAQVAAKDLERLAREGSAGNRADAALLLAGIAAQSGQTDNAARQYAAVAADLSVPQPYRDLAAIRDVTIRFDGMAPQQVVDRLKPMAVPGNAWFGSAGELVAMAYLKQGKPELAGPLFAAIAKDKSVPDSLRGRARLISGQLGVDPGESSDPAPVANAADAQR